MSPRALIGHVVFLVLAFAFAWTEANHVDEKKGGPSSVVLLDAKKGDVVKVEYTWPKGKSVVESKGKEAARQVTFNLSRELDKKAPEKKKDAGPDAGPADDGAPLVPEREEAKFPGGKSVVTSLEAFEPLKTRRTLGADIDDARLTAMGLTKPERSLVITTANGKTLELEVGESAYGGQGRYARVKGDKTVHLLESATVTGFEGGPETLMEKRIVPSNLEDVEGYAVRYGDKNAAFTQRDREQSAKRKMVPEGAGADEPAHEAAGKLMTTLRTLRALKVADAKVAGSAVAGFVIDLAGRDKQKVEVLERNDGEGHLVSSDGWLFEISETQSKELLEDIGAVFDAP